MGATQTDAARRRAEREEAIAAQEITPMTVRLADGTRFLFDFDTPRGVAVGESLTRLALEHLRAGRPVCGWWASDQTRRTVVAAFSRESVIAVSTTTPDEVR